MTPILLSYPRSGRSWIRFFVETVSQRPSEKDGKRSAQADIDVDKKGSSCLRLFHDPPRGEDGPLLVVVRDYLECVPRQLQMPQKERSKELLEEHAGLYMAVLRKFEEWKGPKKLVYYEDLMTDPRGVLAGIAAFLALPQEKTDAFLGDLENHRKRSIRNYGPGSRTQGKNLAFHQGRISLEDAETIRAAVRGPLAEKYLARYDAKEAMGE